MNIIPNEPLTVDIINYLAIDSLEKIGNIEPTESEISAMEKKLIMSISSILNEFRKKQQTH